MNSPAAAAAAIDYLASASILSLATTTSCLATKIKVPESPREDLHVFFPYYFYFSCCSWLNISSKFTCSRKRTQTKVPMAFGLFANKKKTSEQQQQLDNLLIDFLLFSFVRSFVLSFSRLHSTNWLEIIISFARQVYALCEL